MVQPEDDLVLAMALSPEDAAWSTCLVTQHWGPLIDNTMNTISEAFTVPWQGRERGCFRRLKSRPP